MFPVIQRFSADHLFLLGSVSDLNELRVAAVAFFLKVTVENPHPHEN